MTDLTTNNLLVKNKIENIINNDLIKGHALKLTMYTSDMINSKNAFSEQIHYLNTLEIDRNFSNSVMDDIHVSINITKDMMDKFYKFSRYLYASLQFYTYDEITNVSKTNLYTYKVILPDTMDPNSTSIKITELDNDTRNTARADYTIYLMNEMFYHSRNKIVNTVLHDVSMYDTLCYIVKSYGFKKTSIVQPDNLRVYDNVILPPDKDLLSIFTYLQKTYGVYVGGINPYIVEDVIYIYPPFVRTENISDYNLTLVSGLRFDGILETNSFYIDNENKEINVLISKIIDVRDRTSKMSVDLGDGFVFRDNKKYLFNRLNHTNENSELVIKPNIVNSNTLKKSPDGRINIKYGGVTDNVCNKMETILLGSFSETTAQWLNPEPFIIKPNHQMDYILETANNEEYSKYKSFVSKCKIIYTRDKNQEFDDITFTHSVCELVFCTPIENT